MKAFLVGLGGGVSKVDTPRRWILFLYDVFARSTILLPNFKRYFSLMEGIPIWLPYSGSGLAFENFIPFRLSILLFRVFISRFYD